MIKWTHKEVSIKDIRRVRKFYILSIDLPGENHDISTPIFVDQSIFEGRMSSYYLRDNYETNNVKRHEVLDVKWNMVIEKGFFYKIDRDADEPEKVYKDPEKFYISFLEIDGPLGTHVPN